jgi:hypothetical protein
MNYKFFKEENGKLIFDGEYMEVYIPDFYFLQDIASVVGSDIETIGIFDFKVGTSEDSKDGKLYKLLLPTSILMSYSSSYKLQTKLRKELEQESYVVLQLYKGNVFINQLDIKEDVKDSKKFINLLHSGKLPSNIPYEKVIDLYHKSLNMNNVNLGVPSIIFELCVSGLYRSRTDLAVPFRQEIGQTNAKVTSFDYQAIGLKAIAPASSTFTALSFENINQSIISSVKKAREDAKESISPIEKTIKY